MKRILSSLLALAIALSLLAPVPLHVSAAVIATGTCGKNLTWTLDEDGVMTISGTGSMDSYQGTSSPWYPHRESIQTVVIEDGVTSIGENAFGFSSNLTSATLGKDVSDIGIMAFRYCNNMTHFVVSESNPYLSADSSGILFSKDKTVLVSMPEAYSGSYTVPDTVTTIADYACDLTPHLSSVTIPDNVTTIGNNAFCYCQHLTDVTIGDGVTTIGPRAFGQCFYLFKVTLGNSVTTIGDSAFEACESMDGLVFPATLTSIGQYAFYSCLGLQEIIFHGSAPDIGYGAFGDVTTTAYFPPDDPSWTAEVMGNYPSTITWKPICTHSYSPVVTAPTCSRKGYTTYICDLCGESYRDDYTDKIAHTFTYVTTPPTCTEWGQTTKVCTECSAMEPYEFTENLGHTWGQWKLLTAATCTADGTQERICSVCDDREIGTIPATGHSYDHGICSGCGDITLWLNAPVLKAANSAATGKIKLTWDEVPDAAAYEIYRADAENGSYQLLKTTTATTFTNTSAQAGEKYHYYVVAVSANNIKSAPSNTVSRTCDLPQPVVSIRNVASSGKIQLTWEKVDGAEKYKVYRSTSKTGDYTLMMTTGNTTYTNTTAKAGKAYYYKVVAVHKKTAANSAASAIMSRTCDLAQPAVIASNVASTGKIKLTWKAIEGAAAYDVYRATSKSGPYTLIMSTEKASYINTSAKAGKAYYYKVVAIHEKSNANSAKSAIKSRTCDLAQPVVSVRLSSTSGKPVVSWKAVPDAAAYEVYMYDARGKEVRSLTTTQTRLTFTSAAAGKTYTYKVVALHKNANAASAKSAAVSIKSK